MANATVTSVNRGNSLTSGVSLRIAELIRDSGGLRALARKATLPPSALSQYLPRERGRVSKPSMETLAKIARAAGVRLDWLLLGAGPRRAGEESTASSEESPLIHIPRLDLRAAAGAGA